MSPTPPIVERAVAHHRAGELEQAAELYLQALSDDPDNADVLQLFGALLHRLGHTHEALRLLDRAITIDRRHPPALINRARARLAVGQAQGAEADLRAALVLRPDSVAALKLLAGRRVDDGRWAEADALLSRLHRLKPDDAGVLTDLAATRLALGAPDRALDAATQARALDDTLEPARRVFGAAARALALDRVQQGDPASALHLLRRSLAAWPDDPATWVALADLLHHMPDPPSDLGPLLIQAWERPEIAWQRLERATRVVLEWDIGDAHGDALITALWAHPLTLPWLTRAVVSDAHWERRLAALRERLRQRGGDPLGLTEALAVQCWLTEYAWPVGQAPAPSPARDAASVAVQALYSPPPPMTPQVAQALPTLHRETIAAPAQACAISRELPTIALSDDAASTAVRAQYEAHPYPRLVQVQRRAPTPLPDLLAQYAGRSVEAPAGPIDVLVAGCGTGQHALTVATTLAQAQVTAIDLSRASLGRAALRARELGIDTVGFAPADILALGDWDRRFDVIDVVGVLHHLRHPMRGWRVLLRLLKPGGLMRVGLYTERGRASVVAARSLAQRRGWTADEPGLRRARAELLALPTDHPARGVVHSPDFYSLSGLRDLVFHVSERRYHPAQVSQMLRELDLVPVALQHANPAIATLIGPAPTTPDLERWDAIEAAHPHVFAGMLVLWCRPLPTSAEPAP